MADGIFPQNEWKESAGGSLNESGLVEFFTRSQAIICQNMGFGDYPKEYNPAVHGTYDPARYYGPSKFLSKLVLQKVIAVG